MNANKRENVSDLFRRIQCAGWADFLDKLRRLSMAGTSDSPWIYRGQSAEHSTLRPLFERCWNRLPDKTTKKWTRVRWQDEMVRDFQRRSGHLISSPPTSDDWLEWLAVMQHYGAPTQLLDWSYSPYVAAHAAVKDKDGPLEGDAAVWAVDAQWLAKRVERLLRRYRLDKMLARFLEKRSGEFFVRLFRAGKRVKFVYPLNPLRLNERLTIQQGVFLCQGDLEASFAENLRATVANAMNRDDHMKLFVIRGCHWDALDELRHMNVTEASLFPEIDGFARDYRYRLFPPQE
ncbi:MAG: FRG domain-containing protein [Vicinamibacteria bacterium]|nr:FRG domain-containing protein [Vicinamibacteria bacterium]